MPSAILARNADGRQHGARANGNQPMTQSSMQVRRCSVLLIEPRESLELDVGGLLHGASAIRSTVRLFALAPHLDREVELDADETAALARIGETVWQTPAALCAHTDADVLDRLLAKGLLVGDDAQHAPVRERDDTVRDTYWKPLAAVAHMFSRWSEAGVDEDVRITRHRTLTDLIDEYGAPPPHITSRVAAHLRVRLPPARPTKIDELLARRATCRNFDTATALDLGCFSDVLKRVVGCSAEVEIVPGTKALKKANPSGGGLHPLEPYLLVQRVDGVAPGLYHYHSGEHALECVAVPEPAALSELARRCVAGQDFFADAHVLVILVARFRRTFWKYRNHPKAYRAIVLEAGHVSQNLYLTATEFGLGVFVTAAINEIDIERGFGLDALQESPLTVCGFGPRAQRKTMLEFDPLGAVWDENGERR
jgi:putative peptide maturation dehydrogenase